MSLSKDLFINLGIIAAFVLMAVGIIIAIRASFRLRKLKQVGFANTVLALAIVTPIIGIACLMVPLEQTNPWFWGMGMFVLAGWCIGGAFFGSYFKSEEELHKTDVHAPKYRDKYYVIGQERQNAKKRRLGWVAVGIGVFIWVFGAFTGGYAPEKQMIDTILLGISIIFMACGLGEVIRGYHIK